MARARHKRTKMGSEKFEPGHGGEKKTYKQNSKTVRTFIKSIRETLSPNR